MIKILVVEDDDTLNALVSLYLKGNGYEVNILQKWSRSAKII